MWCSIDQSLLQTVTIMTRHQIAAHIDLCDPAAQECIIEGIPGVGWLVSQGPVYGAASCPRE